MQGTSEVAVVSTGVESFDVVLVDKIFAEVEIVFISKLSGKQTNCWSVFLSIINTISKINKINMSNNSKTRYITNNIVSFINILTERNNKPTNCYNNSVIKWLLPTQLLLINTLYLNKYYMIFWVIIAYNNSVKYCEKLWKIVSEFSGPPLIFWLYANKAS